VPSLPKNNFRMRNPFLYRGLTHQSRRSGSTESRESRRRVSLESRSVTLVTWREIHRKKGLLLLKTGLHLAYHLDPVQGPAGSRFRDILPLPKPVARFLIFGAVFPEAFGQGHGVAPVADLSAVSRPCARNQFSSRFGHWSSAGSPLPRPLPWAPFTNTCSSDGTPAFKSA